MDRLTSALVHIYQRKLFLAISRKNPPFLPVFLQCATAAQPAATCCARPEVKISHDWARLNPLGKTLW
jgi:hypothetical protein